MSKTSKTTATVIVIVILSFLLSACSFKPTQTASQNKQTIASPAPTKTTINLDIKNKKLVSIGPTISLKEGDNVQLITTSDEKEELHIHGYDIIITLKPNEVVETMFIANKTGRFEFELEDSGTTLGAFEVLPK